MSRSILYQNNILFQTGCHVVHAGLALYVAEDDLELFNLLR